MTYIRQFFSFFFFGVPLKELCHVNFMIMMMMNIMIMSPFL